ncbi:MAG: Glutamyl-tRNA(Gln) amidotransferase subunit A [Bryobacteraceae bacterium]|nr:Glutamyl-tRNA(Gln) amidotransferase subunit A [Bryobacteraceae bacterium]
MSREHSARINRRGREARGFVLVTFMDRREWVRLMAVLGAAVPVSGQQRMGTAQAGRISKGMLVNALKLMGLECTDAQLELMLPRVNRGLGNIEALRKIDVPLDTEPATTFSPLLPGRRWPASAAFRTSRPTIPRDWKKDGRLPFLSVLQLSALVRARAITSVELTRLYLARLKQYAPRLNFVITFTEDLALDQAARADAEIRRGRYRGALHGIPWGAKDLFAVKGVRTTWGAEPYQNQVTGYDATVVERLEKAGAVLLAKLSMGALAMGGLWFGGMTKTPWDQDESSSGSSAGSASATAAGCVGFSLGTETLGSILSPSIRCGAAGLRPTYGRVSRHGAMALSWTMDKVGPICRSVEDCALVLRAIHGPDGRDGTVIDAPFAWDARRPLSRLRVGVLHKDFEGLKGEEKLVYTRALADLGKAGVRMTPVELPPFDAGPLLTILSAEGAAAFDDLTRGGGLDQLKDQGPGAWPNSFRSSRLIPAVEYIRAQRARRLLMREMDRFMEGWDVLVSPPYAGQILTITNLTGHPQAVAPCGFAGRLPRGIVFTGRLCEEGLPLRVALAYEKATKWHTLRPPWS